MFWFIHAVAWLFETTRSSRKILSNLCSREPWGCHGPSRTEQRMDVHDTITSFWITRLEAPTHELKPNLLHFYLLPQSILKWFVLHPYSCVFQTPLYHQRVMNVLDVLAGSSAAGQCQKRAFFLPLFSSSRLRTLDCILELLKTSGNVF